MTIYDRAGQALDVAGPRNKGLETRGSNPAGSAEFVRLEHSGPDPATNSARGNVEDVGHLLDRVIFLVHRPICVPIVAQRVCVAEGRLPGRRLGAVGTGPLRRDSTLSRLRRHRRRIGHPRKQIREVVNLVFHGSACPLLSFGRFCAIWRDVCRLYANRTSALPDRVALKLVF
jgi:hypothetical protein